MARRAAAWHGGAVSIDRASSLPPPPVAPVPAGASGKKPSRRGRPAFGKVIVALVGLRLFREAAGWVAVSSWGPIGALLVGLAAVGVVLGWRAHQRNKVKRRGGIQHTPEEVAKQLQDSELLPPAFAENGTIAGTSILVLNQLPKVLEVETQYEAFGSDGQRIGTLRQIGQSRGKQVARVLTTFDQFFTHHFELEDLDGEDVLRLTRPRKLFKSKLRVFDGQNRFLGQWVQQNVFWKIRWTLLDAAGQPLAHMKATNLRGVGLPRRGRRPRGGHHHQVVGGLGPHGVDPRGPLRDPHQRGARAGPAADAARHTARDRPVPQAGRPRVRLRFTRRA